ALRLIPIPSAWNQPDNQWVLENGAAVARPPQWTMEQFTKEEIDTLALEGLPVRPDQIDRSRVAPLHLPAQVLAPPWPPDYVVNRLNQDTTIAYSQLSGLHHPWDIARVISGAELRQHRCVNLTLLSPRASQGDWRFSAFYTSEQAGRRTWRRLADPDGD